jgi:large subunit ribosomal protein L19
MIDSLLIDSPLPNSLKDEFIKKKNTPNYENKKNLTASLKILEKKYQGQLIPEISVGDIIQISYKIIEGDKDRLQTYQGIIISKQNKNLGKSITLRRIVQGIGVEQVFFLNSPKIVSIIKKQSSKIRRSKLYFLRGLTGKKARLKKA